MTECRTAALIVAAGLGKRAGLERPKQFAPIGGKPVIAHSVDAFAAAPAIGAIWVVAGEEQLQEMQAALAGRGVAGLVAGGATRRESVRNGLIAIEAAGGAELVLIHDAARPGLGPAVIHRLIAALERHPGAVPVLPVADTLARAEGHLGGVADRDGLVRVQTPQAFRFDAILAAHRAWQGPEPTDDAQMLRAAGGTVDMVEGDPRLQKLTFPGDIERMEAVLTSSWSVRTGTGFDVHRFEAGRPLMLCGIHVPHAQGLAGHSDADVALHALTDALLGAMAEGDIGSHFPPTDARWKNADSASFVEHARDLLAARGGSLTHVDLTIICEAPKIGPHREAMRARIAQLLRVEPERISVKATTTERLGFTGRGEGIAAQAIATIRIPDL